MRLHPLLGISVTGSLGLMAKVGSSRRTSRARRAAKQARRGHQVMVLGLAPRRKPGDASRRITWLFVETNPPGSDTISSKARSHSKRVAYGTELWG